MIGNIIVSIIVLLVFGGLYFLIGWMTADLTRDSLAGKKKKGRTILFWPWVLVKLLYQSIRGMRDGWEW